MIQFQCDYSEGAHPRILEALAKTNLEQSPGYGEDCYCAEAAGRIRALCGREEAWVHFVVGGTQANLLVIQAALRPWQGVLCAGTGHIQAHETGAIEAGGHKVLPLPEREGKITAEQVEKAVQAHSADEAREHTVQPGMVYLSQSTELGTLYSRAELEGISRVCRENGLFLYVDGARLGYALASEANDLTLPQLAELCDAFTIGGTKQGALFGEAIVLTHPALGQDFRYLVKQRGGLLAKGRLLGLQFGELLRDGLYFELAAHADRLALRMQQGFLDLGFPLYCQSPTNQQFIILPDGLLEKLAVGYRFSYQARVDGTHSAVRFCTSWATKEEDVEAFLWDLRRLVRKEKG